MRLQVGEAQQCRRVQAFDPARIDDLDRDRHRVDQCIDSVVIEAHRVLRRDVGLQAQCDLGLDGARMQRPVGHLRRTREHTGRRQRRMRQHRVARRAARLPMARRRVAEPAEHASDFVLHCIGVARIRQLTGPRRRRQRHMRAPRVGQGRGERAHAQDSTFTLPSSVP